MGAQWTWTLSNISVNGIASIHWDGITGKTKTHSEFLVLEFVIEIGCVLDDVHDLQKIVPELK